MNIQLISFTNRGEGLANRLAEGLAGEAMRCGRPLSLDAWTRQSFLHADGLIFVGAAGIAVRAIAPYVKSKAQDPAVVVVDETGRFAISLLSGHLGGANALAQQVARLCGATPVITTATDQNGVFAVDSWAKIQGCMCKIPRESSIFLPGCCPAGPFGCAARGPLRECRPMAYSWRRMRRLMCC